ncbi:MAG TPA: class IV adenylate cyclase [Vicinamibacteria bacterium]|jgi:adenylate cyclase class 2
MAGGVETEIKLRVASAEEARAALRGLGARLARARHLEDNTLFDHPRLGLFASGTVLRVRRVPGEARLTYKGARRDHEGVKSRTEHELEVGDADALCAVLAALGFRPGFRYQKYRETYLWRSVEIVVDETPLGPFLEIEGPPDAIHEAAAALGRSRSEYLTDSYASLWRSAGHPGDMVFADGG